MTWQSGAGRGWRVFGGLLLLGGLWGSSFPLIRIAAPSLGAAGVTHARILVAALILVAITSLNVRTARVTWRSVGGAAGPLLLLAAFNVALPLTLVATAIVSLNASLAAVLNATTPMFSVAVAAVWLHQAVSRRKIAGVIIGILGVVILVGGASLDLDWSTDLAVAASLTAGLLYALGGVYTQVRFATTGPFVLAMGQQLAAAVLLIPVTAAAPPTGPLSTSAAAAVLVVGAGATTGGYLLYFWIIRQAGPVAASTVTLIVPIAGSVIGVLWLDEPVTPGLILGATVILTAVGLLKSSARTQHQPASGPQQGKVAA